MCNLNVIVVLEFISRNLYLLFAIFLSSKFQSLIFYQHMRPKSGLKFPRPFLKSVKTDINSITDFQNMPEYTNNKEPGLCVFESDIFIN